MGFATALKLSWKKEKSRHSVRLHRGYGRQAKRCTEKKSSISTEIILRLALSIFMCTGHVDATRWKHQQKHFALFAIFTQAAAPPRFFLRPRQRRSMKSGRSCKRFAIVDQQSR